MSGKYNNDEISEFCERLENTHTPALADTLDRMGYMNQIMHIGFSPIIADASIAGPAFTMDEAQTKKPALRARTVWGTHATRIVRPR